MDRKSSKNLKQIEYTSVAGGGGGMQEHNVACGGWQTKMLVRAGCGALCAVLPTTDVHQFLVSWYLHNLFFPTLTGFFFYLPSSSFFLFPEVEFLNGIFSRGFWA
jgi:hypothetical protein